MSIVLLLISLAVPSLANGKSADTANQDLSIAAAPTPTHISSVTKFDEVGIDYNEIWLTDDGSEVIWIALGRIYYSNLNESVRLF